jgi:hypothetical protein
MWLATTLKENIYLRRDKMKGVTTKNKTNYRIKQFSTF